MEEKIDLDRRIEDFAQDFLKSIKESDEVPDAPKVTIHGYAMGDSFRRLNGIYKGKGILYLGQAIAKLLDDRKIRFLDDRGIGYYLPPR